MELKESSHKRANGGKTLVAYGPRDEGGYSLDEYNGGRAKELFRSESLEEIQAAFRNYYAVKAQFEKGMPWKMAGNHLVICREAPAGKFEVRQYNSSKGVHFSTGIAPGFGLEPHHSLFDVIDRCRPVAREN
jgi:hypothetical protein